MFGTLGMTEILIVLFVALLIFGPRQLPKLGRSLGDTIREFRQVGKQIQEVGDDVTMTQRTDEYR